MKKFLTAIVLAAGLLSATASASDFNYVGASYQSTDVTDRSFDRYEVDAAVEVSDAWFLTGGYSNGFDRDAAAGVARLGVGLHNTVNDAGTVDLYGIASGLVVVEDRADLSKYNYELEFGVRHQVTPRFEVRSAALATNLRDKRFEDIKYFGAVTGEYAITKNFRLNIGYVGSRDYNEGNIGARWYF